ncbi:MAG: tRNA (N6-isopentenyl adenosine(37)-C2)-methylthiotransferase MiaB [Negativicutes bacterium]|nr:tRNA (N6-isopentenyl adenosine(37)-C2)-methylthiotransferase MiaB [Negativicutes bacterium]
MAEKYFFIETFGCQMNEHDSEMLAGALTAAGWDETSCPEQADLLLVNTCCVRDSAEKKIYGKLGEYKRYKRCRPGMVIAVAGCLAGKEGDRLLARFDFVDLVITNENAEKLPALAEEAAVRRRRRAEVAGRPFAESPLARRRRSNVTAWVAISRGCDNFCSYCIVPYVRGREVSRRIDSVVSEIASLVAGGIREVTLLGQNVNSFGRDNGETFGQLLTAIEERTSLQRLRFMTSHPRDFSPDIIDRLAASSIAGRHIHLPVQAGSDRILAAMNRGYTVAHYEAIIGRIREKLPGFAVTTDIIVGFPGESEEDFAATLALVERLRFDAAFTFLYSPRSRTPAASRPDQIDPATRKERLNRLMAIQNRIADEINRTYVGKTVEVLVEKTVKKNRLTWQGRCSENKLVFWDGCHFWPDGEFVTVRVTSAKTWQLSGVVIGNG